MTRNPNYLNFYDKVEWLLSMQNQMQGRMSIVESNSGNIPDLSTVALTGLYNDLLSKPTIPIVQVQSDYTQVSSGEIDYVKNKPILSAVSTTGSYNDLSATPVFLYKLANVNGLVQTTTKIFTTISSRGRFLVESIRIVPKTLTGSVIIAPIISCGWTTSNYNDLVIGTTLTSPLINLPIIPSLVITATTIPISTDVYINVVTAGTGYSTCLFDIYIKGFYES